MKTHSDMSSDKIIELYGNPKSIKVVTCGSKTDSPWGCTIWEYGDFSYEYATFYFRGRHGSYILNHFVINRD